MSSPERVLSNLKFVLYALVRTKLKGFLGLTHVWGFGPCIMNWPMSLDQLTCWYQDIIQALMSFDQLIAIEIAMISFSVELCLTLHLKILT